MHEPLAEVLLEKLCTAVQKVQEEYASGQGIIKDGQAVNQLCQSVDDIFSHGLKEGILTWAAGSVTTYWPLVVKITYKEVIQDIMSRTSLKSDRERCQVWVRVAAQENTLGSYLNIVTQEDKLLREFYQPHAFVFDEVNVDTAKTALLYGLSHLDFNISLDIPNQAHTNTIQKEQFSTASLIPDKSSAANGYHLSYSAATSYPGSLSRSPNTSLTKGRKKKKKIKSSVALIADSLDENDGRLTSVEQYMSSSLNDCDNKQDLQTDSLYDLETKMESLSNIRLTRTVSGEFESIKNEGIDETRNISDSKSIRTFSDGKEIPDDESLQKQLDNVFLKTDGSISAGICQEDIEQCEKKQNEYDLNVAGEEILSEDSSSSRDDSSECRRDMKSKPSMEADVSVTSEESLKEMSDKTVELVTSEESLKEVSGKTVELVENTTTETSGQSTFQKNDVDEEENENLTKLSENCTKVYGNLPESSADQCVNEKNAVVTTDKESSNFENEFKEINDEVEYKVSCARYEFGTPTETSFNDEELRDTNHLSPDEGGGLNFVPGIHKDDDWRSRSSSFNSFSGSGSFSQPKSATEKVQRTSTIDSNKYSSASVPSDSWRFVNSSLSRSTERKDSKADDMSVATEDSFSDLGIFEELLGMQEDHFSTPENFMGFSTSEELEHSIRSCRDMIKAAPPNSLEKKQLVERLIKLRVKLQESKEESSFVKVPDAKKILGHQFVKEQDTRTTDSRLCDRCGKWIWTMWQSLYTCKDCSFHCHRKCLDMIRRPCASRKVTASTYNLSIAPECGLNAQQYKCVECRKRISMTKGEHSEARLCDYSGQFFCEDCHWNDQVIIPARMIHNWDFTAHKVSRQTKQFLDLMIKKPLLNLEQLNPALFKFVGELREIKKLREEILVMKKYFMSCRTALESKLLLHLQDRQHFVDNSNIYSLQDVLEVERGTMLPFVTRVHSLFLTHIKSDCELCRAKGFVCELCKANEIIFAFDPHAVQCVRCRTVFHKLCFKKDSCPKCQRIQKRTSK